MIFERALELWILLCACLAFAGWAFSAFSVLGGPAYAIFFLVFAGMIIAFRRRVGLPRAHWKRDLHKALRRFKKFPAFLFLCLAAGSAIGALSYPTIHFDSLSYRLPRVLHWLAEGQWHWIHTPDTRMNVVASSTEWVWTPMMLLTDSERILCFSNLVSYLFLPGLLYAFFTRVGISRRLAWWWMWLLPAAYCYAFQAGSLATDGYAAIFCLASVVYALKAREKNNAYYLWVSILAIGFATGTKQTNIIVVPLWFLAMFRGWRLLLQRPALTAAVCLIAILASFLPNCLANIKYAGSWNGFRLEPQSPLWSIIGNSFAIPIENLLPPVFPAAREWNAAMERFVETPFGSHFAKFENFALLYRGASENSGGLGLTTCLVLVLGLLSFRKRRSPLLSRPVMDRWVSLGLLIIPWLLVLVFMASVTISRTARYLAFFYPFLFAGILYLTNQPYRWRWWRTAACLSMVVTLGTLALLRQRPLFPVSWTSDLVERFASKSLADRTRNAFSFVPTVRGTIDTFHNALPAETTVAGYISEAGNLELALWHPYGSRRVWRFNGSDSREAILAKGIEYVILDQGALTRSGAGSIENWLAKYQGEIIFSQGMPPEPDFPIDETYLIKLKR